MKGGDFNALSSSFPPSRLSSSRSPAVRPASYGPPTPYAGSSLADRVSDVRCVKPFVTLTGAFGCGQCLPCRVARRRTWTHRILLEAIDAGEANCSFVTLTYAQDQASLLPEHLQLWLKRFRKRVAPRRVRFFGVGEYGDISWRPHYHVALFGHGPCVGGVRLNGECQCSQCLDVRQTWGFGHVLVARLEMKSAQYIAGYVVKKMTRRDDPRLYGRAPEFSRMSLRPGIGASAMENVASEILRYDLHKDRDVPLALRYGDRLMPLGRYLRRRLRVLVGKDEKTPPGGLQEAANRLSLVRRFAFENDRSVASVFNEINGPLEASLQAKEKLRRMARETL